MIFQLYQFFFVFIVPGLIGALAFSIVARLRTEIQWTTGLIIGLLTFTTMITGLYFIKNITTVSALLDELKCLSFTRRYILLSTGISIFYGGTLGLIRRLFTCMKR